MTLFSLVAPDAPLFEEILKEYFYGEKDSRTVEMLVSRGVV
jgi:uncharacterized protein (DUF1810 family)